VTAPDLTEPRHRPITDNRPFPGLTDEQRLAATAADGTLFIEAGPGTGKTTVSAHRFGVQRFDPTQRDDHRAVVAVSFTRAATWNLWHRVRRTWGPSAVTWPHRVVTLDTIMCDLLHDLLRCGLIRWPDGYTELNVVDSWASFSDKGWGRVRYELSLTDTGNVTFCQYSTEWGRHYPPDVVKSHLKMGKCTHADIRTVLELALNRDVCITRVRERIATTIRALIIDEAFDANDLDIAVIENAILGGVAVTLVGDPWQALYAFRGARPRAVAELLHRHRVRTLPLTQSFRWRSDAQRELATHLRAGDSVVLLEQDNTTSGAHVVLSREWKPLWVAGDYVLPLAFGSFKGTYEEAAATLLLNQLTRSVLSEDATYLRDALTALAIADADAPDRLAQQLQEILGLLKLPGKPALSAAYGRLSEVIRTVSPRKLRPAHASYTSRLVNLGKRLTHPGQLIPGLTTHQAKGREWDSVVICLADSDSKALASGLQVEMDSHRQLYVACTRARHSTVAICQPTSK
jgi:DNA helicase II / ATP-dependent DNA helicase PcrA